MDMAPKAAWKAAIDGSKPGADFFLTRTPAEYNPLSYFKHRGATSSLREQLSHELSEWVKYFSASDKQIHHDIANSLRSYRKQTVSDFWNDITEQESQQRLREKLLEQRKNDLRRQNVTQLRIDGDAMTEELEKASSESSTVLPLRAPPHVSPQEAQYKENITDQDEPSTKQPGTILGKRDRDQELEEHDLQRSGAEKGERAKGGPNTKKSATHVSNPFQSETIHDDGDDEDDDDDEKEEDAVTLVQEQGHHSLNVVFDYEAFAFSCVVGHYDISVPFNDYYEEAIAVPYDHNTFQDFLHSRNSVPR